MMCYIFVLITVECKKCGVIIKLFIIIVVIIIIIIIIIIWIWKQQDWEVDQEIDGKKKWGWLEE
jgi:cell division protein FtsL